MTFLTATLCFMSFATCIKDGIKSKRILHILGAVLLLILGIVYFLIFLIDIFLK